MFLLKTQVTSPSELYIADASLKNINLVSNFNSWVKEKKLSLPERKLLLMKKG
ncbi:MAG: hypothetical protein WKF59_00600 [Chitinophagaceae bacterium]